MGKIKILVVGMSSKIGGVEREILSIIQNSKDITFEFLCYGTENEVTSIYENYGTVHFIPKRSSNIYISNKMQKDFFEANNNYDVIWINTSSASNITTHRYAREYTKSIILTHSHGSKIEHNNILFKYFHYIRHYLQRKRMIKLSNVLIACSDKAALHLYGKTKNKVYIIHNGIDISKFKFDQKLREEIRKNYNIRKEDILIGMVGRIEKVKNPMFIIKMVKKLYYLKNYNVKIMLIGEGSQRKKIEKYIKNKEYKNNIILTGFQNDSYKYYNAFDFFVLPSLFEGFPLSAIEAQANGLKCIISKNITKEVRETDLVTMLLPNKYYIDKWIENILLNKTSRTMENSEFYNSVLYDKGYDTKCIALKFYNIVKDNLKNGIE